MVEPTAKNVRLMKIINITRQLGKAICYVN